MNIEMPLKSGRAIVNSYQDINLGNMVHTLSAVFIVYNNKINSLV